MGSKNEEGGIKMALTILESLADKRPNGRRVCVKNTSLAVMYDLVRKHRAEIEEAVSRGYSWSQIDEACRISWQVESDKASEIVWWKSGSMVQSCYYAVKNGTSVGAKKSTAKETVLDVRITKR